MNEEWCKKASESLEKLDTRLDGIDKKQTVHSALLNEHIRGVRNLEQRSDRIDNDLIPIKIHVAQVNSIFKILGVVATLVGVAIALVKVIS